MDTKDARLTDGRVKEDLGTFIPGTCNARRIACYDLTTFCLFFLDNVLRKCLCITYPLDCVHVLHAVIINRLHIKRCYILTICHMFYNFSIHNRAPNRICHVLSPCCHGCSCGSRDWLDKETKGRED